MDDSNNATPLSEGWAEAADDGDQTLACDDCAQTAALLIVSADLGPGAFLAVLCDVCWHRRQYRAELEELRARLRRVRRKSSG
jgi:hypothetical protein